MSEDFKPIHWDSIRAQIPAWFYMRLDANAKSTQYFIIPIPVGFNYLLREVRTKWPEIDTSRVLEVFAHFVYTTSERTLQQEDYPIRLISTPGRSNVQAFAAPSPVNNDIFGLNFTATPPKNNIVLNYYYQRKENLDLRVNFVPKNIELGYVDILFQGYLMPDEDVDIWD